MNAQNLNQHQWENRLIIIKTNDAASKKFQQQVKEFSNLNDELKERKLVVYQVANDQYKFIDFGNTDWSTSWKNLEGTDLKHLSENVAFKILLIGLDAGMKMEKTEVVNPEEIFGLIDSMPMRQSEMRRKNKN